MVMAWLPAGPARLYSARRTLMLTGSSSPEPRMVHRAVTAPAATAASLREGRWDQSAHAVRWTAHTAACLREGRLRKSARLVRWKAPTAAPLREGKLGKVSSYCEVDGAAAASLRVRAGWHQSARAVRWTAPLRQVGKSQLVL